MSLIRNKQDSSKSGAQSIKLVSKFLTGLNCYMYTLPKSFSMISIVNNLPNIPKNEMIYT